jgi:hypothetical protein
LPDSGAWPGAGPPGRSRSAPAGATPGDDERLARLGQLKLRALVRDHWGGGEPAPVAGSYGGGPTLLDRLTRRAWALADAGSPAALGPALVWASRNDVHELHVLVEGTEAAAVVARRAQLWARPPRVWVVERRRLAPAVPAPAPVPIEPPAAARAWIPTLLDHGAEVVVEHGVILGEVRGLEVARVVPDAPGDGERPTPGGPGVASAAGTNGAWHLEVGVGRHDRRARNELLPDEPITEALTRAVGLVRRLRVGGAARHPANTLARERWLRSVVVGRPELAGAASLQPVAPPLPRTDLLLPTPAVAEGPGLDGSSLVVACSTGVDLDLVPSAADARHILSLLQPSAPAARLVLVLPEGDDYPVTRDLAAGLAAPAEIAVVPRAWEALA